MRSRSAARDARARDDPRKFPMSTTQMSLPKAAPARDRKSQQPRSASARTCAPGTNSAAHASLYGVVVAQTVPSLPARGALVGEPWSESNMREQYSQREAGGKGHTPAGCRLLGARPRKWRPAKQLNLFKPWPRQIPGGHISTTEAKVVLRGGVK